MGILFDVFFCKIFVIEDFEGFWGYMVLFWMNVLWIYYYIIVIKEVLIMFGWNLIYN